MQVDVILKEPPPTLNAPDASAAKKYQREKEKNSCLIWGKHKKIPACRDKNRTVKSA